MTTTVFLESVPDSWEAELRTSIFDMAGCFWVLRAVGIGCLLLCCRGRRRIREARLQTTVALYRRGGRNKGVRVLLLVLHPTASSGLSRSGSTDIKRAICLLRSQHVLAWPRDLIKTATPYCRVVGIA